MDHFGIGAAIQGAARIYIQSARRTGRTTSLVESVQEGDRVFFSDIKEAHRVLRLCKERGVNIECLVVDPKKPEQAFSFGTSQGRTLFDHSWVEQYYLQAIERAQNEIDHFQQQLSGYGEAHQETKRKAEELAKWRF